MLLCRHAPVRRPSRQQQAALPPPRPSLFGVGAIGLGVVLIFTDLLPLSGAGTGVGVAIGGLTVLVTMAYSIRELRRAEKTEENEDAE